MMTNLLYVLALRFSTLPVLTFGMGMGAVKDEDDE